MTGSSHPFLQRPKSKLGRWAAALMLLFLILWLINTFVFMPGPEITGWGHALLPFYGIFMVLCGLASGVVGLIALLRNKESSWLVWLSVLPGALMLFLLVGEFLVPH